MENEILTTIKNLGASLVALSFIAIMIIQYFKEVWGFEGLKAEVLSLVVGFVLSALVVLVYLANHGYNGSTIAVSEWVGSGLFLIVGTLSPNGGYKVLGSLLGSRS